MNMNTETFDMNTFNNNCDNIEAYQAALRCRLLFAFVQGALAGLLIGLVILLVDVVTSGTRFDPVRTFTLCIGWCGIFSYCICLLKLLIRR